MGLKEEVKIILGLEGTAAVNAGLDQVTGKFSKANQQINQSTRGALALGSVIGRTVVPELQGLATLGVSAFGDLRHIAILAGTSIAGIGVGAAAIAGEIWLLRNAYTEMMKAIDLETKAVENRIKAQQNLNLKIEEELELLRKAGMITEQEELWALSAVGPNNADIRRDRLRQLQNRTGTAPVSPFAAFEKQAQQELLEGRAKEIAQIEETFRAMVKENGERARRNGFTAEQLQQLNQLAELNRDQEIAALGFKDAEATMKQLTDERVKAAKEATEAAKEEERAMASIVASAREIAEQKRRGLALASDFAFGAMQSRAGDTTLTPENRAALMGQLADMELAESQARIEQEILDEQLRNQAIQDARTIHAQRMIEIGRSQAEAERQINDLRLAATTDFFRNVQNAASVFGKEGFAVMQAAAIAEATVATYTGATKAFSAMADIPYVGPVLGTIYAAAAVASGIANIAKISAATPGYEVGGYTGDMAPHLPAGVVHGREFVFSAPATAAIGRGNLEAMHDAAKSGGGGGMKAQRVVVIDDRRQVRDLQHDPEFETVVVDIANRNKWRMG